MPSAGRRARRALRWSERGGSVRAPVSRPRRAGGRRRMRPARCAPRRRTYALRRRGTSSARARPRRAHRWTG
ncbi:hypothetical protein ACFPRL_05410 [Pseudoclavibacter helvolus]